MVCHLLINAIIVAPFWRNPSIEDIQQLKNFEKPLLSLTRSLTTCRGLSIKSPCVDPFSGPPFHPLSLSIRNIPQCPLSGISVTGISLNIPHYHPHKKNPSQYPIPLLWIIHHIFMVYYCIHYILHIVYPFMYCIYNIYHKSVSLYLVGG